MRKFIMEKLAEGKLKNSRFSLRAMAKRLDVDPSTVSQILNGKRGLSWATFETYAKKLLIDPARLAAIKEAFEAPEQPNALAKIAQRAGIDYHVFDVDRHFILSDWVHGALLCLINNIDFQDAPEWIAARLQITPARALEARERLLRSKLLRSENGRLAATHAHLSTGDDLADLAIQSFHKQALELAEQALAQVPVHQRYFGSLTLAFNMSKWNEAKSLLREFESKFAELVEEGPSTEVFELSLQLVPRTRLRAEAVAPETVTNLLNEAKI